MPITGGKHLSSPCLPASRLQAPTPRPPHTTAPTAPRSSSCKAEATTKKLAGAALTSFMKKCETDSTAACDAAAVDKKLAGAAKTSISKKCVTPSGSSCDNGRRVLQRHRASPRRTEHQYRWE